MARSNPLTVDIVGKMTTYELRQEADQRGLTRDLKTVNHQTLTKRLVQVVIDEEYERGRQMASNQSRVEVEKERLQKAMSERKAAALERSKQRQADHDYFHSKKNMNVQAERKPAVKGASPSNEEDESREASAINPRRHKVFVR